MADIYTIMIAGYGAILSTILLIWTIIVHYRENIPRLKVRVDKQLKMTSLGDQLSICIIVANIGKIPVTLANAGFNLDLHILDGNLPKKIEEGESYSICVDVEILKRQLTQLTQRKPGKGEKTKLKRVTQIPEYAWVRDQTGKEYRCEIPGYVTELLS